MWESDPIQIHSQCTPIPGRDLESEGITAFSDLTENDLHIYNKYETVIAEAIREVVDSKFPEDFQFVPSSIARQIEANENCYLRFDLPHRILTVKILPHPHENDLSRHITIHQEPFVSHQTSLNELTL